MQKTSEPLSSLNHPDIILCTLLDHTNDIIYRAVELEIEQYKTTLPQAKVLFILARARGKKGVTLADLSKMMLREPNSISTLTNRMQKAGLIKKIRDNGENRIYVTMTPKGKDLFMNKLTASSMITILSVLTDQEKKNLELYLKKLREKGRQVLGIDLKPPYLRIFAP